MGESLSERYKRLDDADFFHIALGELTEEARPIYVEEYRRRTGGREPPRPVAERAPELLHVHRNPLPGGALCLAVLLFSGLCLAYDVPLGWGQLLLFFLGLGDAMATAFSVSPVEKQVVWHSMIGPLKRRHTYSTLEVRHGKIHFLAERGHRKTISPLRYRTKDWKALLDGLAAQEGRTDA